MNEWMLCVYIHPVVMYIFISVVTILVDMNELQDIPP